MYFFSTFDVRLVNISTNNVLIILGELSFNYDLRTS